MTKSSLTLQKVIDHLSAIGGHRTADISPDTEIYYDLLIYGDVLYFDLLGWAHKEFDTAFDHFNPEAFAPREQWPLMIIWRKWRLESDRRRGRYRSFKVRDLVEAIESKAWPPG